MQDALMKLKTMLQTNGYSLTRPRQHVFLALLDHEPQSMSQLIERIGTKVDRASVYRAIECFEKAGIVQRLSTGWKYKLELSDEFTQHHHHLTCTNCEAVFSITEDPHLERLIHELATQKGFRAVAHQLEIRGLCASCR